MTNILKKYRIEIILSAVASFLAVCASVYFYVQGIALANGDAIAHLNISRRVVDSLTPGFAQLGYVWLPLSHVLSLPFIWIDALYYSGFAGTMLSMAAYVGASIFVYKIARLISGRVLGGIAAFVLFAVNPNVLYAQSTPLTEAFYLFTLAGAVYYLLCWVKKAELYSLIAATLFLLAGNFSRYDGWFITFAIFVLLFAYEFVRNKKWEKTEAVSIIFGLTAFLAPVLWLVWNWVLFHNPLNFATGEFSAKAQQLTLLREGGLPSYHNLANSIAHIFYAGQLVAGWGLLAVGVLGALYSIVRAVHQKAYYQLFFLVLGLQLVYYVVNVYVGNGVIFVPELAPHKMFNIRYALTFLPFFAVAAGVLAARSRIIFALLLVVVVGEYGYLVSQKDIIVVNESVYGYASQASNATRIHAGRWLAGHYTGGKILGDTFVNDTTAFFSRIPLKEWVSTSNTAEYGSAFKNPSAVVDWVLERQGDAISRRFSEADLYSDGFGKVYENNDVAIYQKGAALPQQAIVVEPPVQPLPAPVTQPEPETLPIQHRIARGESLWDVAEIYFGDGKRWPEIAAANHIQTPDLVRTGTLLTIPQ